MQLIYFERLLGSLAALKKLLGQFKAKTDFSRNLLAMKFLANA